MGFQAVSEINTNNASRYLQALCGHFNRKVTAEWSKINGAVDFGFGHCQLSASESSLVIHIQAEKLEEFEQLKYIVADHLQRFATKEALKADWKNEVNE